MNAGAAGPQRARAPIFSQIRTLFSVHSVFFARKGASKCMCLPLFKCFLRPSPCYMILSHKNTRLSDYFLREGNVTIKYEQIMKTLRGGLKVRTVT